MQPRRPPSGATAALALVAQYPDVAPREALRALLRTHDGRVQPIADSLRRPDDGAPIHRDGVVALAELLGLELPEVRPGQRRSVVQKIDRPMKQNG